MSDTDKAVTPPQDRDDLISLRTKLVELRSQFERSSRAHRMVANFVATCDVTAAEDQRRAEGRK